MNIKKILFITLSYALGGPLFAAAAPNLEIKLAKESALTHVKENAEQALVALASKLGLRFSKKITAEKNVVLELRDAQNVKCAYLSGNLAYCADSDKTPGAYLYFIEINKINFRKKGLAKALFKVFHSMCLDAGCKKIFWLAMSSDGSMPNNVLVHIYTKFGGRKIGISSEGGTYMECDVPNSIVLENKEIAEGCCLCQ